MFVKKYEERLALWREFRDTLESSDDPLQDTINLFSTAPTATYAADPYSQDTWPNPWELIEENNYCSFVKILAICYTLQLTDRFSRSTFEIHITQDKERSSTDYLLYIDDIVIGLNGDSYVHRTQIPPTTVSEITYAMPAQQ